MSHKQNEGFVSIPRPKLPEAIGTVAVKWSSLESQIDNLLYWASDPNDSDFPGFLNSRGFQHRCEKLKSILRSEHAAHAGTTGLIALIDQALGIKSEREQIIHGIYTDPTLLQRPLS